jgi:Meiotically up-regulated gene 113
MPVYIVRCTGTGRVKIGYSAQPYFRADRLSTSSPYPLELLRLVPGDRTVERLFHRTFAAQRAHREWFTFDPAMLDFDPFPGVAPVLSGRDFTAASGLRPQPGGRPWVDLSAYGMALRVFDACLDDGYEADEAEPVRYMMVQKVAEAARPGLRALGFHPLQDHQDCWLRDKTPLDFVSFSKVFPALSVLLVSPAALLIERPDCVPERMRLWIDLTAYDLTLRLCAPDQRSSEIGWSLQIDQVYPEAEATLRWLGFAPRRPGLWVQALPGVMGAVELDLPRWQEVLPDLSLVYVDDDKLLDLAYASCLAGSDMAA